MKALIQIVFAITLSVPACAQTPQQDTNGSDAPSQRADLYHCEGCEAAAEAVAADLDWRVKIAGDDEAGEKLVLSGRVFKSDGKTPAAGVILYMHQTNAAGIYPSVPGASGWAERHGKLRGWLVTDSLGRYEITTVRPAPYPNRGLPAHVHVFVKEPDRRPYYVDDFVFERDPFVTQKYRSDQELRGGSGIIRLARRSSGGWSGQRDIVLEK